MPVTRRSFLKRSTALGLAAGAALPGEASARLVRTGAARSLVRKADTRPNILFIIVDQFRHPRFFPDQAQLDRWLPNLARIRRQATSFENHYTASNMCVASRGAMLTGLYSHQTGCMLTLVNGDSTLSPSFPTWGTMLRDEGYNTNWYGKWHLAAEANEVSGTLEPYGFNGGTFPSPNGAAQQGLKMDSVIAGQFDGWFEDAAEKGPWCTTVSLVNPHDINWWPNSTNPDQKTALDEVHYDFGSGPPNLETSAQLAANKPKLQLAYQQTLEVVDGPEELYNTDGTSSWDKMLNMYVWYQQQADAQIGRVLDTLYSNPRVAENTIVMFTSDHGEYGGAHGLRAKGGGVYEEGIRVPLYVLDPRHVLSEGRFQTREQFTSTVDLAPMLLTIARGSHNWRGEARYEHLKTRHDLVRIAEDAKAPGRPYIAHATDEISVEQASPDHLLFPADVPNHINAVRTRQGKYALYSNWADGTNVVENDDQESELYDYTSASGVLELNNIAAQPSALSAQLSTLLNDHVIPNELNAPLPAFLKNAQEEGYADYYTLMKNPANTE